MIEEKIGAQHLVVGQAWHQRLAGWVFRNHRWFGVVSCLGVIAWGASGVMHPIMSRLNPQPVNAQAPQTAAALHAALAPAEVLTRAGISEVSGLRVLTWEGASYYQASVAGQAQRRYFEINSGHELADGDIRYAGFLARHFVNDPHATIIGVTLVENFDDDYLSVNRLLPVYRVDFSHDEDGVGANGLRAYVETNPPRLASLVDDTKATLGWLFRVVHKWDFLRGWDNTRLTLITLLLSITMLSALSGIWMYGFMWRRGTLLATQRPLRRWHRGLGITVSLTTLLFTISGMWHLLGSEQRTPPPALTGRIPAAQLELPDNVRHSNWRDIALVQMGEHAYYQLDHNQPASSPNAGNAEHDHSAKPETHRPHAQLEYALADSGKIIPDTERQHAIWLAGQYSGLAAQQIETISQVTKFEGEYGFINKRLPVWRIDYVTPNHVTYYVETRSGALATIVDDAARREGWSFSYLHKYHWLDFAGKNVRDFVGALFALGNVIIAMLGLWMFARRYVGV